MSDNMVLAKRDPSKHSSGEAARESLTFFGNTRSGGIR